MPARKYTERQRVAFMALIDRGGSVRAAATKVGVHPDAIVIPLSQNCTSISAVEGYLAANVRVRRQGPDPHQCR